ncbi:hypothetical protein KDN32_18195 [Nocardioides sp. J2M5]|uniref:hypothetical protein n=1 Tax=Nocardioides palaemonis TaxID=2829810 RepID=UPI001BA7125E|nr:hypothetical protein [Nocardioides palaemonis]MBS2939675.1 hypothetical protein [Nocardioides palaemonis]
MLTDDDLTRQLGEAFREDVHAVTYEGPVPQVRTRPVWARPGLVALPAVGAVAAAVLVAGSLGDTAPPAPPGTTTAPTADRPADRTVAEELHLAGMTFTYERGAGDPALDDQFLRKYDPGTVPGWAEPVALEQDASAKVWVGQDPASGSVSMFVQSPGRWEGRLVGLASPSITVEQMTSLAQTGRLS